MNLWSDRDPRAKVLFACLATTALVLAPAIRTLLGLPVAFALVLTAGITSRALRSLLLGVGLLWLLSILFNAFLGPGPRVGPEALGWARPSEGGLRAGLVQGARLAGLAMVGAWLGLSTGVLEFAGSLEWTARRAPGLRRRIHRGILPLVLAVRVTPLLVDEARRLLEIERLRGGPMGRLAGLRRLARLAPVWMILVVERAEALVLALTLRGYDPDRPRGFARGFRWGLPDWGLLALGTAAALGARA